MTAVKNKIKKLLQKIHNPIETR